MIKINYKGYALELETIEQVKVLLSDTTSNSVSPKRKYAKRGKKDRIESERKRGWTIADIGIIMGHLKDNDKNFQNSPLTARHSAQSLYLTFMRIRNYMDGRTDVSQNYLPSKRVKKMVRMLEKSPSSENRVELLPRIGTSVEAQPASSWPVRQLLS